jgi:hypothetical protein
MHRRRRLTFWLVLSLLLGAGTAWTFARPDVTLFNSEGYYSHAFGWRSGSVFYRKYAQPERPAPVGDWVAENRARPPVRRWGWSGCGVTSQYIVSPGGRQHTWTFGFPLTVPLAITAFLCLRALARLVVEERREARQRLGLCPNCGYDWRATPSRCPECGWQAGIANPPLRAHLPPIKK